MAKTKLCGTSLIQLMVKPMKSIQSTVLLLLLLVLPPYITGCSGDEESVEQDSVIDQAVQKVADRGVDYIQTPIEKAKAVKEIEDARRSQLEEQSQ